MEACRVTVSAATYRARQSEKAFQATVVAAAEKHGWLVFHWPNALINPIWPDLTLIRDGRVIFAELKREDGRLSPKQKARLWELAEAGMEVYIWRPSAWDAIEMTLRGDSGGV
jgi:hypothetical protein